MTARTVIPILIALAGCVDAPRTSTTAQGLYCDPWCDPTDTDYLQQADYAMQLWAVANCQSCSTSCDPSPARYPDGTKSAICNAHDSDGWTVAQCWVTYRGNRVTDRGCASIPVD